MRRLLRWAFNGAAALSALLLVAVLVVWAEGRKLDEAHALIRGRHTAFIVILEDGVPQWKIVKYQRAGNHESGGWTVPVAEVVRPMWDDVFDFNMDGDPLLSPIGEQEEHGQQRSLFPRRRLSLGVEEGNFWGLRATREGHPPDFCFWYLVTPLWLLAALWSLFPGLWTIRRLHSWSSRRSIMAGRCTHCGYDLRATPGRCPECGTVPPVRS